MKIIKIIKGMTVINGKQYAVGDCAFQIDDDAKAARLVTLGAAMYTSASGIPAEKADSIENDDNSGSVDVDSMSYDELKAKASELGIKYPGKKKTELIAEIKAALDGDVADVEEVEEVEEDAPTFNPVENVQ